MNLPGYYYTTTTGKIEKGKGNVELYSAYT